MTDEDGSNVGATIAGVIAIIIGVAVLLFLLRWVKSMSSETLALLRKLTAR